MSLYKAISILLACTVSGWGLAALIDRIKPEAQAPDSLYPPVGSILHSEAEGFTSEVLAIDEEHAWLQLTMRPYSPGPPPHVHTSFAELFRVSKGSLSLRVGEEIKVLHAGEEFRVSPGVVHQPFNATSEEVVVRGPLTPEYALPRDFILFLSQIYHFIDESPANAKPPRVLFQMALFSPRYDSWMAKPSISLQRAINLVVRPVARALGYRCYYPRFIPVAAGLSRTAPVRQTGNV